MIVTADNLVVTLFLWSILPCQSWLVNKNLGGNYACVGADGQYHGSILNKDNEIHPRTVSDVIKNGLVSNDVARRPNTSIEKLKVGSGLRQICPESTSSYISLISVKNNSTKAVPKITMKVTQEWGKLSSDNLTSGLMNGIISQANNSFPKMFRAHLHDTEANTASNTLSFEKYFNVMYVTAILAIIFASLYLNHYQRKATTTECHNNESMSERMHYLLAIFDTMGMGVVSTDNSMKVTFMNSAAGLMCGCIPEEITGRHVDDIVRMTNGSDRLKIDVLLRESYKKHVVLEDCKLVVESGGFIDVQQSVCPLTVGGELRGSVMVLQEVGAARALMKKLSYTASHDSLTGLPNRANFEQYLRNVVSSSIMRKAQHALVYLDLDGFKAVNDRFGHAAGDALLKQVSHLMRLQLRKSDYIARLGGDEFAFILFNCEIDHARVLIQHLLKQISEHVFCFEGNVCRVGASAGITRIDARSTSVNELLAQADSVCYNAKKAGKGTVCLF